MTKTPSRTKVYTDSPFNQDLHGAATKAHDGRCSGLGCTSPALISRHWKIGWDDSGDGWWAAYCIDHAWTSGKHAHTTAQHVRSEDEERHNEWHKTRP